MNLHAQLPRALRALALVTLLLAALACKKDDEPTANSPAVQEEEDEQPRDAGGGGDDEIEDPRVGPDGAVQVRAMPEDDCDAVSMGASSYFFCPNPLPYTIAIGSCVAAGSSLVTINDADENQALVDQMVDDMAWIGFSDAFEEENWMWQEGSGDSDFVNWDEGEPIDADFVFMRRENGRWAASTDVPMPYICEVWR